mmetsp:Transcript_9147/g.13789  ORF Transcript_9147/g.13789 Transcript_9147/m.13789 type:complete len:478 (-) Transcript_9147:153-1586(-)
MKSRNIQVLSHGIRSILVRNLCPSNGTLTHLPFPGVEIAGIIRNSDAEITTSIELFKGNCISQTSNPSWTTLNFKCEAFADHPDISELHIKIYDCRQEGEGESLTNSNVLIYECFMDIKRMVRLGPTDITSIPALPLNAIFFTVEDGGLIIDDKLYVTLRSSGLISIASKQSRIEVEEDDENGRDEAGEERRNELQKRIDSSTDALNSLRNETESLISSQSELCRQLEHRLQLTDLDKLRREVEEAERMVEKERRAEEEDIKSMEADTEHLRQAIEECMALRASIDSISATTEEKREELIRTKFILEARQLKLFCELANTVYPIEPVPSSTPAISENDSEKSGTNGTLPGEEYTIRGIELPMVIDTSLKDDEQVSTALGYIVHLLLLASKYLQVPLRYEVIYQSSRSMIRDTVTGRGLAYPLFKRGVERDKFDRALMWLQKDVEQIMALRSFTYDRKKSILGNLKHLFSCEMCRKLS